MFAKLQPAFAVAASVIPSPPGSCDDDVVGVPPTPTPPSGPIPTIPCAGGAVARPIITARPSIMPRSTPPNTAELNAVRGPDRMERSPMMLGL